MNPVANSPTPSLLTTAGRALVRAGRRRPPARPRTITGHGGGERAPDIGRTRPGRLPLTYARGGSGIRSGAFRLWSDLFGKGLRRRPENAHHGAVTWDSSRQRRYRLI